MKINNIQLSDDDLRVFYRITRRYLMLHSKYRGLAPMGYVFRLFGNVDEAVKKGTHKRRKRKLERFVYWFIKLNPELMHETFDEDKFYDKHKKRLEKKFGKKVNE